MRFDHRYGVLHRGVEAAPRSAPSGAQTGELLDADVPIAVEAANHATAMAARL